MHVLEALRNVVFVPQSDTAEEDTIGEGVSMWEGH